MPQLREGFTRQADGADGEDGSYASLEYPE